MDGQGHIIGIDLGTTNSVVAVIEGSEPVVIPNAEGQHKTPSVVAFTDQGEAIVGEIALRQATTHPQRTVSSVKRLIGRLYQEIIDEEELYPYALSEDEDGRVAIEVAGTQLAPERISALILQKLKAAAEDFLGEDVTRAIVTVPAYFDDLQRQATLEAAREAGLEVLRLLNEPTAAAMAYGLGRDGQHMVAVYDFGGGTFDFSLLEIDGKTFEVLTTTGNSRLGGDDLDNLLVDYMADQFMETHGIDLRQDISSLRRLKDAAERAKCELSTATQTVVNLPFITMQEGRPLHYETVITRDLFEELIEPLVKETLACCSRGLHQARMSKKDITKVILVGGSTRIPLVQDSVEDFFGIAPFKGLNPDEIVAVGAATQGAVMNGALEEVVLLDVTPHCLGIELKGNRKSTIIEKNSSIPIKVCKTFTTTEDNQSFVNIHALQGDGEKASECRSIGKFTLSGIQQAPAGTPRIRVTFFINADGIVEISANDMQSGVEKGLTINHAYLSADERRLQGSAGARLRRRRRQAAMAGRTGRTTQGLGLAPETDPGATPPGGRAAQDRTTARGRQAHPAPDKTPTPVSNLARPQLTDTFKEVNSDSERWTKPPIFSPLSPTAASASAAKAKAQPQQPPAPEPARPAEPAPPSQSLVRRKAEAAETDIMPPKREAAPPRPAPLEPSAPPSTPSLGQGGPDPLQCAVPPALIPLVEQLSQSRNDAEAAQLYTQAGEEFLQFCSSNPEELALQLLLVRYHAYTRQATEACSILERLRTKHPEMMGQVLDIYDELCQLYPDDRDARKNRAVVAMAVGEMNTAMTDLEYVSRLDESDEDALDKLDQVYTALLKERPEHTIKFRLVKLHLRRQRLDSAIALLQQLVTVAEYRDRANKVLGLCFWQKGMRYLAWQKFRGLPLDDEMLDILYRLADDMERHDECLHAKYALERIQEHGMNYRDVGARLKGLGQRLLSQREDRYPGFSVRAPKTLDQGNEFSRRFEIINEINRGSMGIVYKARDLTLDEVVAIKVLNDFLCTDPEAIERFKLEARSARKLTHNHIVRIHDMFDLDGKKIISMEYIEGENLKTLLARQSTFTEDKVLTHLVQICEGLAYAHRLHVVHRDIKPANIMITDRNLIKITDFGIAKLLTDKQTKTATTIMGTPLYMAPEQIQGGHIDHRCDIYSLGIMLYELVTGQPPFHEGNIEYQHIHHPAPEIKAEISDRLRRVIMRCIEKRPESRFQTVEEILASII